MFFKKDDKDIKKHKLGYFLAEESELKHISEVVGTLNQGEISRHPLTFMLEAADDIAYATADLEDAFKKRLFELSAQTILSFLLKNFIHAILYYDYQDEENQYVPSKADKKYISIFSDNYKHDYEKAKTGDETFDLYLRLLMVTDYISGMTDSYARTLYRELSGIE